MAPPDSEFCSPFDAALARSGVGAVFLMDREGLLRFDPEWTRDCWGRAPASGDPSWCLMRDRAAGHVQVVWCSAAALLVDHPRMQMRIFESRAEAEEARARFGWTAEEPW